MNGGAETSQGSKVRIAFVSTMEGYQTRGSSWTGSEELWSQAARRLAAVGHTVAANVWRWQVPTPELDALQADGVTLTRRWRTRGLPRLSRWRALSWIRPGVADLVVISMGQHTDGLHWMARCRQVGVPYAAVVQAAAECNWPPNSVLAGLRKAYEGASACYFVSESNREIVESQLATRLARSKVVRNPFKVSYDEPPPWPSSGTPGEPDGGRFSLACVGRLDPASKGQDILVRVLAAQKWRDVPLSLTLYGSGDGRETIERLIVLHGLTNVHFGGFESDISRVWAKHHALILPSRYEGLPLAAVEAMLCSRPCIVTQAAGGELIQNGVTGYVASAATVAQVDDALSRAWEQRSRWERIGRSAAALARSLVPPKPADDFADEIQRLAGMCLATDN